ARNVIADHWRDRAAGRESPLDDELSERLASSCLAPMVERLSEPYREAIRLTDIGSHTQAEAAAALGLSVPGMKARVQRGREQLRDLLEAYCRIELDRRGQVRELERNGPGCGGDGCSCSGAATSARD